MNCAATLLAVLAGLLLFVGCMTVQDPGDGTTDRVNLNIRDRWWDPVNTPDEGWCGEASIQMAIGYYRTEVSHVASTMRTTQLSPISPTDHGRGAEHARRILHEVGRVQSERGWYFILWIQDGFVLGLPGSCGMKLYPDEHPQWYVDHFVLAVGFDEDGLILNTQLDCDGQSNISYEELASTRLAEQNYGYAFADKQNRYFGRIITGVQ